MNGQRADPWPVIWSQLRFFLSLWRSRHQRPYALRWLRSLRPNYLLDMPCPWLTFTAIDFLGRALTPGLKIFEYGSGGSTLFWLQFRPERVVSVEHDAAWYAALKRRLAPGVSVDYRLILPEPRAPGVDQADPADPGGYASSDPAWAGHSFRGYAAQIDAFPDGHFDVVLVDGRARPACLRHSAPKVKPGGWLILDNSDRAYYLERTAPLLRHFERRVFAGATPQVLNLSETTLFTRVA